MAGLGQLAVLSTCSVLVPDVKTADVFSTWASGTPFPGISRVAWQPVDFQAEKSSD